MRNIPREGKETSRRGKSNRLYRAYLLRCWREEGAAPDQAVHYRFSVEEVLRRQSWKGFDSLEALFALLQDELTGGGDEPSAGEGTSS